MNRPWTPDEKTETGTRVTVKRVCDGCGERIGDVTDEEIERAIAGLPSLSVIEEHGCQRRTDPIQLAKDGLELAEKTTPGPWEQFGCFDRTYIGGGVSEVYQNELHWVAEMCDSENEEDAAFIAWVGTNFKPIARALIEAEKMREWWAQMSTGLDKQLAEAQKRIAELEAGRS